MEGGDGEMEGCSVGRSGINEDIVCTLLQSTMRGGEDGKKRRKGGDERLKCGKGK